MDAPGHREQAEGVFIDHCTDITFTVLNIAAVPTPEERAEQELTESELIERSSLKL